jgi:mannose-6-phosphate isomerase-like protein (cupin superfamily)
MSISAYPKARRGASSSVTYGAGLTFETLLEHDAGDAPFRLREHEDTLLRVIAGIVRLSVDGEELLLGIGDEAIVPARSVHRLTSAGGEARVLSGLRRAA